MKKIIILLVAVLTLLTISQAQTLDMPIGRLICYDITSDTTLYIPARGKPWSWNSSFGLQVMQADTSQDTAVVITMLQSLIDSVKYYCTLDDTRLPKSLGSDPAFIIVSRFTPSWYYALKLTGYVGGHYFVKVYQKKTQTSE